MFHFHPEEEDSHTDSVFDGHFNTRCLTERYQLRETPIHTHTHTHTAKAFVKGLGLKSNQSSSDRKNCGVSWDEWHRERERERDEREGHSRFSEKVFVRWFITYHSFRFRISV